MVLDVVPSRKAGTLAGDNRAYPVTPGIWASSLKERALRRDGVGGGAGSKPVLAQGFEVQEADTSERRGHAALWLEGRAGGSYHAGHLKDQPHLCGASNMV